MNIKEFTATILKRRSILVILPLIAFSCVLLLFWALRIGMPGDDITFSDKQGINTALPDANLTDDRALDKMSYYDKAASDSAKRKELMKNDPFYRNQHAFNPGLENVEAAQAFNDPQKSVGINRGSRQYNSFDDPNEDEVYRKIDELNAVLKNTSPEPNKPDGLNSHYVRGALSSKTNLNKSELEVQTASEKSEEDPEIKQLNGMLERILDIQHPERVKESLKQAATTEKAEIIGVIPKRGEHVVSLFTSRNTRQILDTNKATANSFYSAYGEKEIDQLQHTIRAVVHETQTIVDGSSVKLRLLDDVVLGGNNLPKNTFVYGIASLKGERLEMKITSIRHMNSLYNVDLALYDMDGMPGIYIPGAITRDVAKQSSELAIQNIGYSSLDPSLKVQAATAGVEAAKSLLSKKVKLIKVIVKSGYQVLLIDEKQKQNT